MLRSINRQEKVLEGKVYEEICRRFLADEKDYDSKKLMHFKNLFFIYNEEELHCAIEAWNDIYEKTNKKSYKNLSVFTNDYKGYIGSIETDNTNDLLYGHIQDISEVVTYYAKTMNNLEKAFHDAVDSYEDTLKNTK